MLHFLPRSYAPMSIEPAEKISRMRRAADIAQYQADRLRAVADEMEAALKESSDV